MDAERTPVIVAIGQATERHEIVSAVDLAARASEAALGAAEKLRDRIQRVRRVMDLAHDPRMIELLEQMIAEAEADIRKLEQG